VQWDILDQAYMCTFVPGLIGWPKAWEKTQPRHDTTWYIGPDLGQGHSPRAGTSTARLRQARNNPYIHWNHTSFHTFMYLIKNTKLEMMLVRCFLLLLIRVCNIILLLLWILDNELKLWTMYGAGYTLFTSNKWFYDKRWFLLVFGLRVLTN
jgi:hypothetical protein